MPSARQQANDLLDLLRRERDALADFLVALAEFDRARRWEDLGHGSLFAFLVKDLGLSSGAAAYRRAAVDLVRRFPQILGPLREGLLCITTVFELSKVITDENAAEVLPRFFGTSKHDAKHVVAELAPEPAPTRTVVTAVPGPSLALSAAGGAGRLADQVRANLAPPPQAGPDAQWIALAPAPTVVEPKTAELSRVPPPRRSRHVPAHVWRAVWERDGGRCAWPLEGGGVCGSTHKLELDHVKGFALGAGTTPDECRILCRSHQLVSARRLYGDDLMDRYVGPKSGACSEPVASYRPAGADVPSICPESRPCRVADADRWRLYGHGLMNRYTRPKGPPRCSEAVAR